MKIDELTDILKSKGFEEKKKDSGCEYSKKQGHVELLCYVEPKMGVQFVAFYRWEEDGWGENGVKGTYDITIDKLKRDSEPISLIFKRTLSDMPECIGDKANAHSEVKKVIEELLD